MRVSLIDLQPGDRLAEDIFTEQGLHVLSRGTVLQERELARLTQLRVEEVEIEWRASMLPAFADYEEPEEAPSFSPSQMQLLPFYDDAVAGCEQLFLQAMEEGKVLNSDVEESFRPLVENFKTERDVISLLLLLNNQDEYTYQHSVQVGMLSFYLAQWLGWSAEEAGLVGKAGFLHDIGKARISEAILKKPDKLTDEEFAEIRKHTLYGHEIITASSGETVIAEAALCHHERMNGKGYPNRLAEDRIHPVSRIVAIADVYSAMISSRPYRDRLDLLTVLKELYQLSFNELDPQMTQTFIRHMLPNFIGKKATMRNGERGTIVMNHPTLLFHPMIKVADRFVDTSLNREYEIQQVFL